MTTGTLAGVDHQGRACLAGGDEMVAAQVQAGRGGWEQGAEEFGGRRTVSVET
jgi:hypothetical protein